MPSGKSSGRTTTPLLEELDELELEDELDEELDEEPDEIEDDVEFVEPEPPQAVNNSRLVKNRPGKYADITGSLNYR